jgi:hypothetical protein
VTAKEVDFTYNADGQFTGIDLYTSSTPVASAAHGLRHIPASAAA